MSGTKKMDHMARAYQLDQDISFWCKTWPEGRHWRPLSYIVRQHGLNMHTCINGLDLLVQMGSMKVMELFPKFRHTLNSGVSEGDAFG